MRDFRPDRCRLPGSISIRCCGKICLIRTTEIPDRNRQPFPTDLALAEVSERRTAPGSVKVTGPDLDREEKATSATATTVLAVAETVGREVIIQILISIAFTLLA